MKLQGTGVNRLVRMAAMEEAPFGLDPYVEVRLNNQVPFHSRAQLVPAHGSMVTSSNPTLSAPALTDPEGDTLEYWFRIATGPDGESGTIADSGWRTTPSFTLPPGALLDGVPYYWKVYTRDSFSGAATAPDPAELRVDRRLGASGPSPFDTVGDLSVNLSTGNAVLTESAPSFASVGGDVGVDFTYNSLAGVNLGVSRTTGLLATYVDDANPLNSFTRRDPNINFTWTGSPGGEIPATGFSATWTGYISTPTPCFSAEHDDGVKIWMNDKLLLDAPGVGHTTFRDLSLPLNQPVPLRIEFNQGAGAAKLLLRYFGNCSTQFVGIVPSDWLSSDAGVLPDRWTMSANGSELLYTRATVNDNTIVLVERGGETHHYIKASAGAAWRPTNVDDDVVTTTTEAGAFRVVVEATDGLTYTFDGAGRLVRVHSTTDGSTPASPEYRYDPTTGNLVSLVDPLSDRSLGFTYAPTSGGAGSCPTTGFATPPLGMLCQLNHPDGSFTKLLYNTNRQLARIENPGGETTDFAYDTAGRLAAIRDPLAHDAVNAAAPFNWPNDDTTRTLVTYQNQKVQSVTAPRANKNDTTRAARSYAYVSVGETQVTVAGITPPEGRTFARRVTFDPSGRGLNDTGLDNLTTITEWAPNADRIVSVTDPTGRRTTTHYDHAGRAVDVYGPAPTAWFDGTTRLPSGPNASKVPRTRTAYDEGMRGLAAQFWTNENLSGPPKVRTLGIDSTGKLFASWGSGGPTGLGVTDGFSSRFTGEITFPAAGYKLEGCADDGVRVFVDDTQIVDRWTSPGCTTSTWTSPGDGGPRRIRVEHHETTLSSDVGLYWITPGGTRSLVPGTNLGPRYGLVTSTTDADGRNSATRYATPATGLASATVVDPDGEQLATEIAYESPGAGFRRRIGRRLPASDYASYVRADAPAAQWRFNENYAAPTASDSSGNGRHAPYPANASAGVEGVTGYDTAADLRFTGVNVGDVFDFSGTAAFSAEAWVKAAATEGRWMRLLSKEAPDANGRQGWVVWMDSGTFGFERWQNGTQNGVAGGSYRPGVWTHVVATYDGTTMRLYVNGKQVGSHTSSKQLLDTATPMYVGDNFKGRIDEAAVYPVALPSWAVTAHWRAASYFMHSATQDATGAYWRLSEDAGITALDSSGNGRHATYGADAVLGRPSRVQPDTAASTDGTRIASAGDVLDFPETAVFALSAWVNPTVTDGNTRHILSKTTVEGAGLQGWDLWTKDGRVGFERVRDGVSDKVEGGTLTVGRWHHVTARYTGGAMRLYVDGEEVGSQSTTRALLDNTGELLVGDGFKGSIQHAVVYSVGPGSGAIRRWYRDGIAQRATGTVHYLGTETRTNPCPSGGSAVQAGMPKLVADPDPDGTGGGTGQLTETVHDVLGRVVASRINTEAWSCTTYDSRGRVKTTSSPAFGSEPARTTTHDYAVGGDPLTATVTDTSGSTTTTVTNTVDLLGRVRSHTDTWGKTTTTTYDQAGRVVETDGPGGRIGTEYRANGWVDAQRLDGAVVARTAYNAVGELEGVTYPGGSGERGNGTSLVVQREESSARPAKFTWSQAGGALLASDEVAYTVGGRIRDEVIDGADHHAGDDFVYDASGRLRNAWVPGRALAYEFSGNNSCGSAWTAGRNANRTAVTDNGFTFTYCYDHGDKLTSTNDIRYFSIAYDSRHNTTTLGDETMVYDGVGDHVATTKGTTTVRYLRDGLGRIVQRRVNGTTVARYSFGGSGDAASATLDTAGNVVERTIALMGGATLTTRSTGDIWSYSNVHGDVMAAANSGGIKVGVTLSYDPYGQALDGVPDNSLGDFDYGWLGKHQRPLEKEAGMATIQMGQRPYVPGLGRFLEVDPVEGGDAERLHVPGRSRERVRPGWPTRLSGGAEVHDARQGGPLEIHGGRGHAHR